MPPFTIELEKLPSKDAASTTYRAKGKLSLETVSRFIQEMRPEPSQKLILEMSGVSFLDSAGVGALVSLCESAHAGKDPGAGVTFATGHGGSDGSGTAEPAAYL